MSQLRYFKIRFDAGFLSNEFYVGVLTYLPKLMMMMMMMISQCQIFSYVTFRLVILFQQFNFLISEVDFRCHARSDVLFCNLDLLCQKHGISCCSVIFYFGNPLNLIWH